MEKYELKNKYEYEEDEIDLVELLKSIIRERKIVAVITILFTILAGGFAFYKSSLPKTYSAEFLLKNNSLNITLTSNNKILTFEELEIYTEKVKTFIKEDKINTYILKNSILNFKPKDIEKKQENEKQITIMQIIEKQSIPYISTAQTENKNLTTEENEIKNKIILLNKNIDEILSENINKEILKIESEFKILNEETKNINAKLKNIIETYNLNLSSDNISENLSLINPILYIELKESENKLSALYSDLKILKTLSENYKDILNLEFNEIKFENSKLNNKLIVAIGIIFGLFAGMFIAIIKEPLKNIIKEIKKEK